MHLPVQPTHVSFESFACQIVGVLKHISPPLFYFFLLYPTLESRRISFKSPYIPEIESIIAFISSAVLVDYHENNCLPSDWLFGFKSRANSGAPGFRRSASSPLEPLSRQITPVSFKMVSGYSTDSRQQDDSHPGVFYLFGHGPGRESRCGYHNRSSEPAG
jgi:hypothetical protein